MTRLPLLLSLALAVLGATSCGVECTLGLCSEGEGEGVVEGDEEQDEEPVVDAGEGEGEGGPITGCETVSFNLACSFAGQEFMQIDCTSGDRYEFQFLGNENADVIGCFLNGSETDRFFSEGFCALDAANNAADENQLFLRIENGCGLVFE